MGQINTTNYPTVSSLADADLLIVENAVHGTGTTTPKQLRENAIGTDVLKTTAQTVTGAINEIWETGGGALRGSGKAVSVTNNIIDTDIDLGRAPQVGDRILVLFDSSVTSVNAIKTYNGSTAVQTPWENVPVLDFHLNGVCIIEFIANPLSPDPTAICARLVRMFEGTVYTAGTGIGIDNGTITNTKPQMGVNIDGGTINSVSSGFLGGYTKAAKYLIITFDCDAVPYNGEYHLSLSQSGSVVIMYDAVLVDPVTGGRYSRNIKKYTTLICEVTNSGTGSSADPILVNVIGEITNDLADKVDAVLDAISEEKTATGNPITITDALPVPAKSLTATLNPIQDLHGYDHPWAGGAGKNKYPILISVDSFSNQGGGTHSGSDGVLTVNVSAVDDGVYSQTTSELNKVFDDMPIGNVTYSFYMKASVAGNVAIGYLGKGNTWINATTSWVRYNITYDKAESGSANFIIYNKVAGARTIEIKDFMIEVGNSMSAYESYSNICPISGRTETSVTTRNEDNTDSHTVTIQLGQTVYGGQVDFKTGAGEITYVKIVMNGQGDYVPNKWATSGSHSYRWYSNTIATGDYINDDNVKSSYLEKQNGEGAGVPSFAQSTSPTSQNLYIFNADMLDSSIVDTTTLCAYLSEHPLEVTYKLATPTELTLTPAQLEMLKGYNRVTMDNGNISLTYKANRLDALMAALQNT